MDYGLLYSHERAGDDDDDGEQALPATGRSPNGKNNRSGTTDGDTGHKRSLSGNLLSRLSFLSPIPGRGSDQVAATAERDPQLSGLRGGGVTGGGGAMSAVLQQQQQKKSRRRKGSLRKTALLGTGKLRLEGREWRERMGLESGRPGHGPQRQHLEQTHLGPSGEDGGGFGGQADNGILSSVETTPTQNSFCHETGLPSSSSSSSSSSALGSWPLRIITSSGSYADRNSSQDHQINSDNTTTTIFSSPSTAATSPTPADTSTTDDEDILTFPRHPPSTAPTALLPTLLGKKTPLSEGGNTTGSGLSRRKSGNNGTTKNNNGSSNNGLLTPPLPTATSTSKQQQQQQPPTSATPPTVLPTPSTTITPPPPSTSSSEWDYTETSHWGWVLLTTTWLVFVIGMGSCFSIWSWAWDVGETPYAPPELEDDPTLPITGYYPALIILTGVMAWVWVVVAWIGMKYFRHAKISGEDG
ncbi:MAG: hypothetical protein M1813_007684 [Trichoglossum hirsutum]|nr:MAG: hypothetical protein M1813_007684 [Trichoglossum hirsutum]